jgi:hypothetical protein
MLLRPIEFISVCSLCVLTACGGTTIVEKPMVDPDDDDPKELPLPLATDPTISSGNVSTANSLINEVNARRDQPTSSILPSGTATYQGNMVTGANFTGVDDVDGLYADVSITAALFAAGDAVSGQITNIHTLDGNTPQERLDGSLAITGTLDDGTKVMTATTSGTLTGVLGLDTRGDLEITGDMSGRVQETQTGTFFGVPTYREATGLYGSVSGSSAGHVDGTFSGTWAVKND